MPLWRKASGEMFWESISASSVYVYGAGGQSLTKNGRGSLQNSGFIEEAKFACV